MGVFFYLNFANVSEKITQYQTHKHYIADFLTGGGGGGGSPPVVLSHFGQRITMDLVVPVAVLRDSHGSGQLDGRKPGTGHQMSHEDMSRKLILELIIYFVPLI